MQIPLLFETYETGARLSINVSGAHHLSSPLGRMTLSLFPVSFGAAAGWVGIRCLSSLALRFSR